QIEGLASQGGHLALSKPADIGEKVDHRPGPAVKRLTAVIALASRLVQEGELILCQRLAFVRISTCTFSARMLLNGLSCIRRSRTSQLQNCRIDRRYELRVRGDASGISSGRFFVL